MDEVVYKRITVGRYDVYVGSIRLGWVIRRPDGWSPVAPANGDVCPTVRGAPTRTRAEAASRLLTPEEEPA